MKSFSDQLSILDCVFCGIIKRKSNGSKPPTLTLYFEFKQSNTFSLSKALWDITYKIQNNHKKKRLTVIRCDSSSKYPVHENKSRCTYSDVKLCCWFDRHMWLNLVKQEEMYEKRNYRDAPASKGSCFSLQFFNMRRKGTNQTERGRLKWD